MLGQPRRSVELSATRTEALQTDLVAAPDQPRQHCVITANHCSTQPKPAHDGRPVLDPLAGLFRRATGDFTDDDVHQRGHRAGAFKERIDLGGDVKDKGRLGASRGS